MQLCPELISRLVTHASTASPRSASSRTRYGSLPPSSRTHFLRRAPASLATAFPAAVLPVRVTAATCLCRMTDLACATEISSVWNSPSGKPASRSSFSMASAQPGTLGACLSSAAFPPTSVGAANRSTCQNGKFQGMMAKTIPIGRYAT